MVKLTTSVVQFFRINKKLALFFSNSNIMQAIFTDK